jgi:hypothetical protein
MYGMIPLDFQFHHVLRHTGTNWRISVSLLNPAGGGGAGNISLIIPASLGGADCAIVLLIIAPKLSAPMTGL